MYQGKIGSIKTNSKGIYRLKINWKRN